LDNLYVVARGFRVLLEDLVDRSFGCPHRRTTFPRTLRASVSEDGQQSTKAETYVACLECGRHLAYDWSMMRISRQRVARTPRQPGTILDRNNASRDEWLRAPAIRLGFDREAETNRGSR
jgi:hypothetical protein